MCVDEYVEMDGLDGDDLSEFVGCEWIDHEMRNLSGVVRKDGVGHYLEGWWEEGWGEKRSGCVMVKKGVLGGSVEERGEFQAVRMGRRVGGDRYRHPE